MPAVMEYLQRRDGTNITSTEPGQSVSADGGTDSRRNIIAMILATALFIIVVVAYQYASTVMTRREEEQQQPRPRTRRKRLKGAPTPPISVRVKAVLEDLKLLLRRILSSPKPPSHTSRVSSMTALLKVKPLRPPKRRTLLRLPWFNNDKDDSSKSKKEARRVPRPLLLGKEMGYAPRSPIDDRTQQMLRSPEAFAEFSDPVRSMNFVSVEMEFQRRKERCQSTWDEEVGYGPERPIGACVAPLAIRKRFDLKTSTEEDGALEVERPQPQPQTRPVRVIYPPKPIVVPTHSSPSVVVEQYLSPTSPHSTQSLSPISPYSPRQLSVIHEDTESCAPHSAPLSAPFSIFEDDSEDEEVIRSKRPRFKFPLPSPRRSPVHEDVDVFSIGSFSDVDDTSEGSGH